MSSTSTDVTVANHAKPPSKPDKTLKVTGKNKAAIDLMVWEGLKRRDAANQAGLKDHALYVALTKPHVKAYYMEQLDVLRTSERARNIHALVEVRDASGNAMARVGAVKALEQISDEAGSHRSSATPPGLTIIIENGASLTQPAPRIINNDDGSST
jgi:hypothetical protein